MGIRALGLGMAVFAGFVVACSAGEGPGEQVGGARSAATRPENCDGYGDQIECPTCGEGEECYVAKWAPGPGLGCPLRACRAAVERPTRSEDTTPANPDSRCSEVTDECTESTADCDCQPGWGSPSGSREMCRMNRCQTPAPASGGDGESI